MDGAGLDDLVGDLGGVVDRGGVERGRARRRRGRGGRRRPCRARSGCSGATPAGVRAVTRPSTAPSSVQSTAPAAAGVVSRAAWIMSWRLLPSVVSTRRPRALTWPVTTAGPGGVGLALDGHRPRSPARDVGDPGHHRGGHAVAVDVEHGDVGDVVGADHGGGEHGAVGGGDGDRGGALDGVGGGEQVAVGAVDDPGGGDGAVGPHGVDPDDGRADPVGDGGDARGAVGGRGLDLLDDGAGPGPSSKVPVTDSTARVTATPTSSEAAATVQTRGAPTVATRSGSGGGGLGPAGRSHLRRVPPQAVVGVEGWNEPDVVVGVVGERHERAG